jgi:hypothetical protein
MNFNFQESNDVLILHEKIQFCRKQQKRTNFRNNYSKEELNEGIFINFPYENIYFSYKSPTTSIPLCQHFDRAGVIPYTIHEGRKYFCLGIDFKYGTLTDFGGGKKKYETFTRAACRELYEESLGIFKISPRILYEHSTAIYDKNMIVLFINVKISSFQDIVQTFNNRFSQVTYSENSGIIWLDETIFYNLIKTGKSVDMNDCNYPYIYKPVADLLRSTYSINGII